MNILFSLRNCPLKVFIFLISDIVMFGIISNMVFKITSKKSAHMFLSLYSLLSKWKGAAAEYERSFGCCCPLYMKRSRIQPLSMKIEAPPGGWHQLVWGGIDSPRLCSHPPLIGLVPIKRACGEVVMCHALHAGKFLEKGWIEEIFNRNRENNKEMNRDNKINKYNKIKRINKISR